MPVNAELVTSELLANSIGLTGLSSFPTKYDGSSYARGGIVSPSEQMNIADSYDRSSVWRSIGQRQSGFRSLRLKSIGSSVRVQPPQQFVVPPYVLIRDRVRNTLSISCICRLIEPR